MALGAAAALVVGAVGVPLMLSGAGPGGGATTGGGATPGSDRATLTGVTSAVEGSGGGALASGSPGSSADGSADGSTGASSGQSVVTGTGPGRVVLAFAGDVHFEGSSAAALSGDLGSAAAVLARADLAVVNLETAVTTRGQAQAKAFTFRAPPKAMGVLRAAGIDVVTVANNHGMDFGPQGLTDTLDAGRQAGLPVIGAGKDIDAAFAPFRKTVNGLRIAVLAATDVLDDNLAVAWTATPTHAGLASAKNQARLVAAVRQARRDADVVAVVLHWGVERSSCPTAHQQQLAAMLAAAGADVVVGSHAHVLGPEASVPRKDTADGATSRRPVAVHYGLGNFVFYAGGGVQAQTGVFTVTLDRQGVTGTRWDPATIRGGRPDLLSGAARTAALKQQQALTGSCRVG